MTDVSALTKSLGDVVINASAQDGSEPDEELVNPSAVLESFIEALLASRDPIVREAFLESCLDALKPRGDASDKGRLAVLHDLALTCIPPFLNLLTERPALVKEILELIAQHGDPREVLLALNMQLGELSERANPYAVSRSDGDSDDEDDEVDWDKAFPQLEEILDMYATAIGRLTTTRSTPTLLAMRDALEPLFRDIPQSAPPELAVDMSRSFVKRVAHLVKVAWAWVARTEDAGGEQNSMLVELLQITVMIFGPNACAELTPRWFLATFPRFSGLHSEEGWQEGQAALDAALATCKELGIDQDGLVERIRSSSSIRPHSSIASLILLAASLPPLHNSSAVFSPPKTTLEDTMPVLSICINGSAVDAGLALTWALVHAADEGRCIIEHDQATFLLEHVMPLIEMIESPNTRLALSKLLGAIIAAVKSTEDQIRLFIQLLEPLNPFESIRVLAISLLREQLAAPPQPSPLLCPQLTEMLNTILYSLSEAQETMALPLPKLMESMYPVWFTESANLVWFLLDLDKDNASGFAAPTNLTALRNLWLNTLQFRAMTWVQEAKGEDQVVLVLDRLVDALARARATVDKALA